jgi:hypothetical protein
MKINSEHCRILEDWRQPKMIDSDYGSGNSRVGMMVIVFEALYFFSNGTPKTYFFSGSTDIWN